MKMINKKGQLAEEGTTNILLWIIFVILAGAAIYFIVKRLTA